jgi:chromosome segregation ATPase
MDTTVQKAEAIFREGDEVFDALKPKGAAVEGFKREFSELLLSLENYMEVLLEKERDIDALHADITQIRDQSSVSKRNIEETILSKENLQANVEALRDSRRKLLERELANRTKISLYSSKFDKLHEAIEVGSGWTAAQDEERQTLEKERDFLTKKLDNKNNLVTGVRVAVDGCYELIQNLENEMNTITTDNDNIRTEIRQLETACVDHAQLSKNLEQKVKNTQQDTIQAVQDYNDRKAKLKSEEKAYGKVEKTLKSLKHKMDSYISEYDKLFHVTHSVSNELEKQKSMNRTCEAEIAEKRLHKSSRESEIASANKEIEKLTQLSAVAKQKLVEVDELKQQLDNRRDELQRNLDQSRDHDLKAIRKQNELLSKQRATLASELEVLRKKTLNTDQVRSALLECRSMVVP